ncbi:unnamed protein product [Camellia sinensis]
MDPNLRNMSAFGNGNTTTNGVSQSEELCRWFSFVEIQSATNDFDDALVIGKGGFGKVYKGFIDGGATIVAIKRSNAESKQGAAEFWTEIKTLSKLRHTHVVTLIGYSDDCEEMILVYEYMANGTLADHLYKNSRKGNGNDIYHLTWEERDLKTTNILLDENWVAKISDFGLSKMVNTSHLQTHVSTDVKGTFGYLDPAYFLTRRLTKKSDVYAFGVVLFEVLCARPPVDTSVEEEQIGLALWAQKCIKKGMLDEIIDPSMRGQTSPICLKVFAEVANKCLHNHSKGRPTMSEIVESLKHGMASPGNICISRIISNLFLFLSTAEVVAKGIDLGWRKWKNKGPKNGMSWQLCRDPFADGVIQLYHRFSLAEIQAATNNFHEPVGMRLRGDIKVYRSHISSGNLEVAIKRWKEGTSRERNLDQFRAQLQVHSHLRHLHIVSLIGYCIDKREVILSTNIWPMGLSTITSMKPISIHLSGKSDLRFALVLHEDCNTSMRVQVGIHIESSTGTVGYINPEYHVNANFTIKSDVYSFGVILLELLCGRKPMIYSRDEDQKIATMFDDWLTNHIQTPEEIWEFYEDKVLILSRSLVELLNQIIDYLNDIHERNSFNEYWDGCQPPLRQVLYYPPRGEKPLYKFQTVFLQTYGVIKYLRTVCEHARDVIQNAWSGKILNELYQVFPDTLRKIHFLMCTKFNDNNDCQKYLSAKNIVKLMRHSPFGYNELKFSIGCATDKTYGVIKYLRTVCEHARDVIQNAWSGKILNELYQVFLDTLRKIHFLLCTKFNDDNDCQKYLSAKNIVKLMRHSPFGYNGLKFSIGCATDE